MRSKDRTDARESVTAESTGGELARRLWTSERQEQQLIAADADLSMGLAQGYEVQRLGHQLRTAENRRTTGYKIGLTSADAQQTWGAYEPVSGYLLEDMVHDDRGSAVVTGLIAPRVEAEVAFLLARPLSGRGVGANDVCAATAQIAPALEIVDTRWAGGAPSLGLLVGDDVSAGRAVIGRWRPPDLLHDGAITTQLTVGARQVVGEARNVLGHPLRAVAWLVRHLARRGTRLEAGALVLSGTLCSPLPATPRDQATADFGPLSQVTTRFG